MNALYHLFQMALDSKTIKEEILDKDIYETNAIRAKGEYQTNTTYLLKNRTNNQQILRIKKNSANRSYFLKKSSTTYTTQWRLRLKISFIYAHRIIAFTLIVNSKIQMKKEQRERLVR